MKLIEQAKEYRKKGLSYREIASLMKKDVKTVYEWVNFRVGKTVYNPR